eukprot:Ihof_evm1s69 gene=Ihof_evmTU1s69
MTAAGDQENDQVDIDDLRARATMVGLPAEAAMEMEASELKHLVQKLESMQ